MWWLLKTWAPPADLQLPEMAAKGDLGIELISIGPCP